MSDKTLSVIFTSGMINRVVAIATCFLQAVEISRLAAYPVPCPVVAFPVEAVGVEEAIHHRYHGPVPLPIPPVPQPAVVPSSSRVQRIGLDRVHQEPVSEPKKVEVVLRRLNSQHSLPE